MQELWVNHLISIITSVLVLIRMVDKTSCLFIYLFTQLSAEYILDEEIRRDMHKDDVPAHEIDLNFLISVPHAAKYQGYLTS